MWTPIKPGAQRRTRTHRHRVITDTWTGDKEWPGPRKGTHRLRTLGIASPFDLPRRSLQLTKLFAIVLCRRIHFLSVKTLHYFSSNVGTPEFNPQGPQDNRQFEQIPNNWRAGFPRIATATPSPPHRSLEGRPRTCTSSNILLGKPL